MDNRFISFKDNNFDYPYDICIFFTDSVIRRIKEAGRSYIEFAKILSSKRNCILIPKKNIRNGQNYAFTLFFDGFELSCKISEQCQILAVGYSNSALRGQNMAMKFGINLQNVSGIVCTIKNRENNYYASIQNGLEYSTDFLLYKTDDTSNVENVLMPFLESIADSELCYDDENENYNYEIEQEDFEETSEVDDGTEQMNKMLDLAENYANIAFDMEKMKQQTSSSIYSEIRPSEYERDDRIAYIFRVDSEIFDDKIYSVGTQIEIEVKAGEPLKGEIIRWIKDEEDEKIEFIEVLFNEQFDYNLLSQTGRFQLAVNDVNRAVQCKAIQGIRENKVPAKYMKSILGRYETQGFDNVDTSVIEAKEKAKKYPPNASQMTAIKKGIQTKDIHLVMGPPGTGKTTVILAWIKHFVDVEHKRVLVSSKNNMAVENVLERVVDDKEGKADVLRIGSESKVCEKLQPYRFERKIESLRYTITSSTEKNVASIDNILQVWKNYSDGLNNVISSIEYEEYARAGFRNYMNREFIQAFNNVIETLRLINENKEERRKSAEFLRTLSGKITKYEVSNNFAYKFFGKLLYNSRIKRIKKKTFEYRSMYEQGVQLVNSYQNVYMYFYQCYVNLYFYGFQDLYNGIISKRNNLQYYSNKPYVENMWDLFANTLAQPINNHEEIRHLQNMINSESERALLLKNIIGEYNDIIAQSQNYALGPLVLESVSVVGATCIGVSSQPKFASLDFDVAIIDEAGQIQIHDALVPMSVAPKVIMLGDHKQIPPTADTEMVESCIVNDISYDLLEKSLFEEFYMKLPEENKTILDTQYRMPGEIADTISSWFYEGKYRSDDFKYNKYLEDNRSAGKIPFYDGIPFFENYKSSYIVIDTSKMETRNERKIEGGGCDNRCEAEIISKIIGVFSNDKELDLKEIGVISAYKAQVKLIKKLLKERNDDYLKDYISEMVKSLDSFQGQEKDIIIYSFTKSSNKSPNSRRIGFLKELRRLNVAMTRAKKMLIMIGDMKFLSECSHVEIDSDGERIEDGSELQFGRFIQKMMADVKKNGKLIEASELLSNIERA